MELKGVSLGFTDCLPEVAEEFNRWYDLDHVPENIALPELLGARRYVATRDLLEARGPNSLPELAGDLGAYLALYQAGVDDPARVEKVMHDLFDVLFAQRRIFKRARVRYSERFRFLGAAIREGIPPLAPPAIPYLPHTGLIVRITDVADARRRDEAWGVWNAGLVPALLKVDGILAALKFSCGAPERQGRMMVLMLTDGDAVKIQQAADDAARRFDLDAGRPGGGPPYDVVFRGSYRSITPLQYDFL